jgi:hypothetical protein
LRHARKSFDDAGAELLSLTRIKQDLATTNRDLEFSLQTIRIRRRASTGGSNVGENKSPRGADDLELHDRVLS